jgi:hypothetical protein
MDLISKSDLADLGKILRQPDYANHLRNWAAGEAVVDRIAIGSIFWKKSIGRPASPGLCDGLTVELYSYKVVTIGTPDTGAGIDTKVKQPFPPVVWDGRDDAEHHWVHFLRGMLGPGKYFVRITIIGAIWQVVPLTHEHHLLDIAPAREQAFTKVDSTLAVVPPFEIVARAFLDVGAHTGERPNDG